MCYLPVAQLDSASDSDSEGRRFKSFRAGQIKAEVAKPPLLLFYFLVTFEAYPIACNWRDWRRTYFGKRISNAPIRFANPFGQAKKKSRVSGFFFLYFSLFSFHSSLFSKPLSRLFQRRDKRYESWSQAP